MAKFEPIKVIDDLRTVEDYKTVVSAYRRTKKIFHITVLPFPKRYEDPIYEKT